MLIRSAETSSLTARISGVLGESVPLTRLERRALLGFIAAAILVGIGIEAIDGGIRPEVLVLEVLLSLSFTAALWRVSLVPAILIVIAAGSVGGQQQALLALAISGGLIARAGSLVIQALFTFAFVASAAVVYSTSDSSASTAGLIVLLLVAAGAVLIGFLLRLQVTRGARVHAALRNEQQRNARIADEERQRIADDLHDVVAHDLTRIAMHAQLLARTTDEGERRRSQKAILAASRQALADLRRVVGAAGGCHDEPAGALPGAGLVEAIEAAAAELRATGYSVRVRIEGQLDAGISRLTVSAIERMVREAGTNIVKHAPPPQQVDIEVRRLDDSLLLRVSNSMKASQSSGLPSGGYGTARMRERAHLLGGDFWSGPHGGGWLLTASLPVN